MHSNGYNTYQKTNVMTSNPLKLVVMLYDGAITYLNQAIEAAQSGDIEGKNNSANLARDIVLELNNSLDTEQGGELASSLRRVYFFLNRHVMKANWGTEVQGFRDAIRLLDILREAWNHISEQPAGEPNMPGMPNMAFVSRPQPEYMVHMRA